MKYYVVADTHGFYDQMVTALTDAGFFTDTEPKELVLCGDMMDRGNQAKEMERFMMQMLSEDRLIFIRGNHEDLMLSMLDSFKNDLEKFKMGIGHHVHNGTYDTALQLSGIPEQNVLSDRTDEFLDTVRKSDFISTLIPASINYFETEHYVFVHGWIPCRYCGIDCNTNNKQYAAIKNWRQASDKEWYDARWINGMLCACASHVTVPNKTVVCGHWHTSWGHCRIDGKGEEFGVQAEFSPFSAQGILAIDACTAYSGKVNCVVIND